MIASAATLATDELHILANNAQTRTLLTSLLIIPLIKLEATFDEDRTAFAQVLSSKLGLTPPEGNINVSDFLNSLSVVAGPDPVHRHTEITNCGSLGSIANFEIPGDIPE